MIRLLFLLLLILAAPARAEEPVLVPDVSQDEVSIRYSFTGAELLLFGAIVYPSGRVPTERTDVVVVMKGPEEAIVLREKRKVAGIWTNAGETRFRSAPGFYAVASSRPLPDIVGERTAAIYELGLQNLYLSPSGALPEESRRTEAGLIDLMRRGQLYAEYPSGVEIRGGVLYRASIPLPARVPEGTYTAETFLIRDGRVLAVATREVRVAKAGFERWIARFAARHELLYGLAAVGLALLLGWGASAAFRRRLTLS